MLRLALLCACAITLLAACQPTFDWRVVHPAHAALSALLPCKPQRAERSVDLDGQQVLMEMLSCETGGALFAIAHTNAIADPARADALLAHWRALTLANLRAHPAKDQPFVPAGGLGLPGSVRVSAQGQRLDGGAVTVQAAWFAQRTPDGVQLFDAVVYAPRLQAQVGETFFSSLKLQSTGANPDNRSQ
ncbi:MAG: hypothetical protein OJF60_000152 [Burkholderiaceae bacterium]|jgi:hypothetical protein|nr:MAG: hypothetical protein OJF60_000152 [Burkholderiaceae bacterium]